MGFGCNAAGVTGCRIIDSPRERLIAIITNSFVPCNGRFPTLIAILTMFFVGTAGGLGASVRSALLLTGVILLGVGLAVFALLDAAMFLFLFLPGPARRLLYGGIALLAKVRPGLDRIALEEKADAHLAEYRRGAQLIRRAPDLLVRVLGLSALQLACSYVMPYVVYRAFGLSGYSMGQVFALQALCAIAVGYLPLPGSAGAAESVFLRGFLLIFGDALVAPAMILTRTMNCYLVLAATAVVLAVGRRVRKRTLRAQPSAGQGGPAPRQTGLKRMAPPALGYPTEM